MLNKSKFDELFSSTQIIEYKTLEELVNIIRGINYPKSAECLYPTKNAILTSDNITSNGIFHLSKIIYISNDLKLEKEKQLRKNDILICLSSGSINHIGKSAFIDRDSDYYPGGFMGILRSKGFIHPLYIYYVLNSQEFRYKLKTIATGTNIKNLSNSICNIAIPILPIKSQNEFINFVEEIDKLKFN